MCLISHRVVMKVCDIVILMRSTLISITKMVHCLDWLKCSIWVSNIHTYNCILLPGHPEWNQNYWNILFLLPYNDILNPGPSCVKFDGILRVKARIEYIYRCWLNVYVIHNSGGCKESPLHKNWWKWILVKLCLFIDMICSVMVYWLFLHILKTYSILSTILMC